MANATVAGPSRGLLDMIFGSKSAEEAEADSNGFGNLMNFIKALNEKNSGNEQQSEMGRTQRETTPGKIVVEDNVVGTPGVNAMLLKDETGTISDSQDREQRERLQRLAMLGMPVTIPIQNQEQKQIQPGAQAPGKTEQQPSILTKTPAAKLEPVEALAAGKVNQALQQKGLQPLSAEEMNLLKDVNNKIEQVNAGQGVSEVNAGDALDPMLQKVGGNKGIDPRKLKVSEASVNASGGPPEKILNTETYLQIHESMQSKASPKESGAKASQDSAGVGQAVSKSHAADNVTSSAVAGFSQKGLNLDAQREGVGDIATEGARKQKLDADAGSSFAGVLAGKTEMAKHDVYLPGPDKPEQMRNVLLAEVGNGVVLHAHKGGGEMRLVIHPDDMGEVKLKVSEKDGKIEVHVLAEKEEVARLIRSGSKELESSLKDQNLSLSKLEISVSDPTSVASTENKSNLSEQLFSQNQQHSNSGFFQGSSSDDNRHARWGAADQGGRQGGGYSTGSEQSGRSDPKNSAMTPRSTTRATDSSRRLDVVA